jgi:hypothetical protein
MPNHIGFPGRCAILCSTLDAERAQRFRHVVALANGDTTGNHEYVMLREPFAEALDRRVEIVAHAGAMDVVEAATAQCGGERAIVGAADLRVAERALFHVGEFVAGRDNGDRRQRRDFDLGDAVRGEHADRGRAETHAGREQFVVLAAVRARVDELVRLRFAAFDQHDAIAVVARLLDRHHAIAATRQYGACGDLNAGGRIVKHDAARARDLAAGDDEAAPRAVAHGDRDAVHHHAVERRLVALGADRLAQHAAGGRVEAHALAGKARQALVDAPFGLGDAAKLRHETNPRCATAISAQEVSAGAGIMRRAARPDNRAPL